LLSFVPAPLSSEVPTAAARAAASGAASLAAAAAALRALAFARQYREY